MNKLKYDIYNVSLGFATVVALACIFIRFCVWCAVGNQIIVLNFLSGKIAVLPTFLFGLLDFLAFAFMGFSLGAALSASCTVTEVSKYRGAFYFVIGLTLACVHHLLFFKLISFFAAAIVAVLQFACALMASVNFYRVSSVAFVASVAGDLWLLYILIFTLGALISV